MVQMMPLPLTVSCFSKIQIGFTFLVPAHLGSPGRRAVKWVCVCVCVCVCLSVFMYIFAALYISYNVNNMHLLQERHLVIYNPSKPHCNVYFSAIHFTFN